MRPAGFALVALMAAAAIYLAAVLLLVNDPALRACLGG